MDPRTCECGCGEPVRRRFKAGHNHRAFQFRAGESAADRFWRHVDQSGPCWIWQGPKAKLGYGLFTVRIGLRVGAHRFAYEQTHGEIPDRMVIDHLCRNPACVNPDHLEAVTQSVNLKRGDNWQRRKTHCPHGHPYSGTNLIINPRGRRVCRECQRLRWVRRYWGDGRVRIRAKRSTAT